MNALVGWLTNGLYLTLYLGGVIAAVRGVVRTRPGRARLLRRAYYIAVCAILIFGSFEMYVIFRYKIGGALAGISLGVTLFGVLFAIIGPVTRAILVVAVKLSGLTGLRWFRP